MSRRELIVLDQDKKSFTGNYCEPDAHGYCATCSDEALPARVLEIHEPEGMAVVKMDNRTLEIDISLVDGVFLDQVLLVHGGVAVGSLDEEAGA